MDLRTIVRVSENRLGTRIARRLCKSLQTEPFGLGYHQSTVSRLAVLEMLITRLPTHRESAQPTAPVTLNVHETTPSPVLSDYSWIGGHLSSDGLFIGRLVPYAGLLWPG